VSLAGDLDRERIRERAIARFSVERMVSAYERVYVDLVEGRAARGEGAEREPPMRPSSVPSVVSVATTDPADDEDGRRESA
jgi:hypothetical protein